MRDRFQRDIAAGITQDGQKIDRPKKALDWLLSQLRGQFDYIKIGREKRAAAAA